MAGNDAGKLRRAAAEAARRELRFWLAACGAVAVWVFVLMISGGVS